MPLPLSFFLLEFISNSTFHDTGSHLTVYRYTIKVSKHLQTKTMYYHTLLNYLAAIYTTIQIVSQRDREVTSAKKEKNSSQIELTATCAKI